MALPPKTIQEPSLLTVEEQPIPAVKRKPPTTPSKSMVKLPTQQYSVQKSSAYKEVMA
jgi:hypothetical protein